MKKLKEIDQEESKRFSSVWNWLKRYDIESEEAKEVIEVIKNESIDEIINLMDQIKRPDIYRVVCIGVFEREDIFEILEIYSKQTPRIIEFLSEYNIISSIKKTEPYFEVVKELIDFSIDNNPNYIDRYIDSTQTNNKYYSISPLGRLNDHLDKEYKSLNTKLLNCCKNNILDKYNAKVDKINNSMEGIKEILQEEEFALDDFVENARKLVDYDNLKKDIEKDSKSVLDKIENEIVKNNENIYDSSL